MPYHSIIITPNKNMQKTCLSSHNCHFVKNYVFNFKLLHVNVQCACIVNAEYPIALSKTLLEVDLLVYAHHSTSKTLYIQVILAVILSELFFNPNSFKHMFNVSALCK